MDVSKTICAALLVVSASSLAEGQSSQAQVIMSNPRAAFLSLAGPESGVQAISGIASEGRLVLRMRREESGEPVRISVLARSNTPYRLMAKVLSGSTSASALIVRPVGAEFDAGTEHVVPGALNVRFDPESIVSTLAHTSIFEGPRISRRGDATTLGNAIVLTFYVQMSGDLSDAELLLQLVPQA